MAGRADGSRTRAAIQSASVFFRRPIAVGLAREFEPHDVVRTAFVQLILTRGADQVVRRRHHSRRIAGDSRLYISARTARFVCRVPLISAQPRSALPNRSHSHHFPPASVDGRRPCSAPMPSIFTFKVNFNFSAQSARAFSSVLAGASPLKFALVAVIGRPIPGTESAREQQFGDTRTPTPSDPVEFGRDLRRAPAHDRQRPRPECVAESPALRSALRALLENAIAASAAINPTVVRAPAPSPRTAVGKAVDENASAPIAYRTSRSDRRPASPAFNAAIPSSTFEQSRTIRERGARCRAGNGVPRTRSLLPLVRCIDRGRQIRRHRRHRQHTTAISH